MGGDLKSAWSTVLWSLPDVSAAFLLLAFRGWVSFSQHVEVCVYFVVIRGRQQQLYDLQQRVGGGRRPHQPHLLRRCLRDLRRCRVRQHHRSHRPGENQFVCYLGACTNLFLRCGASTGPFVHCFRRSMCVLSFPLKFRAPLPLTVDDSSSIKMPPIFALCSTAVLRLASRRIMSFSCVMPCQDCCSDDIEATAQLCSVTGAAPCVVDPPGELGDMTRLE